MCTYCTYCSSEKCCVTEVNGILWRSPRQKLHQLLPWKSSWKNWIQGHCSIFCLCILLLRKRNLTEQELIIEGQFCIFKKKKKFTTKGWYNSLTREWQLRRGNSSRKSWWSGKSTYFVGIFWGRCQLAVSTYLLKHDYSARKDWADSVSITSTISHFLPARCSLDRFSASLAFWSGLGTQKNALSECCWSHIGCLQIFNRRGAN